jgi:hypothetical protein
LFRGEVTLAERPEQVLESGTDDITAPGTTVPVIDPDSTTTVTSVFDVAPTTAEAVPFETIPEVNTEDIVYGVVPDANRSCT